MDLWFKLDIHSFEYLLYTKGGLLVLVIPLVLVVALLYFFSMDKILLLIAFVTPLSIYLVDPEFNLGISIPAEPLMFGVLIIVILKLIGGFGFDQKIIRHPLSLSVFAYFGWILVSTLTSEIPIVSVKFFCCQAMVCDSIFLCCSSIV